jgi:hypothetical protein
MRFSVIIYAVLEVMGIYKRGTEMGRISDGTVYLIFIRRGTINKSRERDKSSRNGTVVCGTTNVFEKNTKIII